MAWDTFVYDNIKKQLVKEGFSEALAQGGITRSRPLPAEVTGEQEGMIYDDCLTLARQYVLASCTKEEKPESGKKKAEQLQLIGHHFSKT